MRQDYLKSLAKKKEIAPLLDSTEYPKKWGQFIGQEPAKRMLQVAAASARLRREAMDHTLISHGTAGIGKTALASLVANELKRPCRVVSGTLSLVKARMLFSEMSDRDVLLYDEFHQLVDGGKRSGEWMLHYLQDGILPGPLGPEEAPKVTIIAATTDVGRLPETITSRFPLVPPMRDYTVGEAAKIAQVIAARPDVLGPDMPTLGRHEAVAVAEAAHCNPRAIRRLLITLRDVTITKQLPLVNGRYNIASLLEWQGVTPDGLDTVAQQYLLSLATEFDGVAGVKALEDRLQQPGGLAPVERVLMDKGLVARTRTGRTLTQAGIQRVMELASG